GAPSTYSRPCSSAAIRLPGTSATDTICRSTVRPSTGPEATSCHGLRGVFDQASEPIRAKPNWPSDLSVATSAAQRTSLPARLPASWTEPRDRPSTLASSDRLTAAVAPAYTSPSQAGGRVIG